MKKQLESEVKAGKESIEHSLGFRSHGRGGDLDFCSSNLSDDEVSGIFDGLGELGKLQVVMVSNVCSTETI